MKIIPNNKVTPNILLFQICVCEKIWMILIERSVTNILDHTFPQSIRDLFQFHYSILFINISSTNAFILLVAT